MTTPRPDYPRPHFDRSHSWLNLNGTWHFRRDPVIELAADAMLGDDDGAWPEQIFVPFPWDSAASTIEARWCAGGWYRRTFDVPDSWRGRRVVLHFGAVHHRADVWIDGHPVGHHEGGYLPFEFDITDALTDTTPTVVVRVVNPADKRDIAHGKQRSVPRDFYDDCAFSPSSGIWQTVWLEARPATWLKSLRAQPTAGLDGIKVRAEIDGPDAEGAELHLTVPGEDASARTAVADGTASATLALVSPRLWQPTDPHLYSVEARLTSASGIDTVTTYTGLRSIDVTQTAVVLNGDRISVRGVLDQGYWPDFGITAPSDEAFVVDLELARRAGFNLVRKHLKTEDPRFLYHADRLGMLVWAEPASTGRFTPAAVAAFEAQIEPMVGRDRNHPSIIIWGLYNEEWGLDGDVPGDVVKRDAVVAAYRKLKSLDRSRPAVDNSGWAHVETDLVDWHVYTEDLAAWRALVDGIAHGTVDSFPVPIAPGVVVEKRLYAADIAQRPNLNSEYGAGFTSAQRGWHQRWQTQELRRHDELSGYVWTELYDVEHELAGVYTHSRVDKDLAGADPALSHAETVVVFDVDPVECGRDLIVDDRSLRIPVRISHHGPAPITGRLTTRWEPPMSPIAGPPRAVATHHDRTAPDSERTVAPFKLSQPIHVSATLPDNVPFGRLVVSFIDGDNVLAVGFVDVAMSGA